MTTDNLTSLGVYLMNGNRPFVGQEVFVEVKFKNLQKAKILSFVENLTDYNRLTMCRVGDNIATVELENGDIKKFPFSMICVDNNAENEYQYWMWKKGYDLQEEMDYFGEDFYE